ncbi:MAG TPA: class D sortase [Gemmatimonadaceae bacterium]|nr:class D sortase [Gemmatimonadaceae bacterium]
MPDRSGAASRWPRRRLVGVALAVTGALMLGYAATGYARGVVARDAARAAWDAAEARRAVLGVQSLTVGGERTTFALGAPVARLVIPRLGLDEIVVEGVGDDELRAGPGHVPGSALPGDSGNAVVSAHRDRHFHALDDLRVGDTLRTTSGDRETSWLVTVRRVVDKDAPALFASRTARLTLTTCWPVRYLGPAPERLIVTAEPIAR